MKTDFLGNRQKERIKIGTSLVAAGLMLPLIVPVGIIISMIWSAQEIKYAIANKHNNDSKSR